MADQGGASSWCGSQSRACGIQERASNIGGELRNAPEARFVSRLPSLASVALTESVLHAQPLPARSSWDARLIRPHKIGRSVDHTAVRASHKGVTTASNRGGFHRHVCRYSPVRVKIYGGVCAPLPHLILYYGYTRNGSSETSRGWY